MAISSVPRKKNLESIFYPESVAVVGANKVPGTVPHDIILNILKTDFQGIVYPVSPRERFIAGAKAYKYIVDIEDPVDLAILVFPASVCHMALEQCGKKGVKAAIIISAGFKEVGESGLEREKQIKEIAEKYNISFIGPNCLGVINTDPKVLLNASFARKMPEEGTIGFLSQSGALCTAVLDYAYAKHIGFSKFVSFGNKADINEIDLLYYLKDDPKTKVILLYLEEISDGPGLMRAARDITEQSGKPILAIKSGRTSEGASAAASHTGSLAGRDEITDAAFRQAGIIRCYTIEEMFNKAIALAYQPLPQNDRIAIITNAGGPGVLTTDAAINQGLQLAKFSDQTTALFQKHLPKTANISNPVDVIGDARADRYNIAVSQAMSFMGEADVAPGVDILQRNKIPHYIIPESMCTAFSTAYQFKQQLRVKRGDPEIFEEVDQKQAHAILNAAIASGRKYLPEAEAIQVLSAYGLPVLESRLATSAKEAALLAKEIGFPLVMKVMSDDIVHKFDVQGVVLDIKSAEEASQTYDSIIANVKKHQPDARIQGILLRKMIPAGEEVILGLKKDPAFGPVIMFGLGGIFVEIFKDISFRIAPLDRYAVRSMIEETKAWSILSGARGKTPRDIEAIKMTIQRLSQLSMECPQISELDINPLIVLEKGKGCFVADAKIMI